MSLFSSFDALLVESNGWKLFNFSASAPPSTTTTTSTTTSSTTTTMSSKDEDMTKKKVDGENKSKKMKMIRNPRFAVELDGLHCFETILPY